MKAADHFNTAISECLSKLRILRESGLAAVSLLKILCPVTVMLVNSLAYLLHRTVPLHQVHSAM